MNLTYYGLYLGAGLVIVILIGQLLFAAGRKVLRVLNPQRRELADSISMLLLVMYYLLELGFLSLTFTVPFDIVSTELLVEVLVGKVGKLLLELAGIVILYLLILWIARKNRLPKSDT